jgi:hypothetical protein
MSEQSQLQEQVRRLVDIEAIKTLKYRYFRFMTHRDYDALERLLTDDVETSYSDGKYSFDDRAKLIQFLRDSMTESEGNIVYWMAGMPEIEITSETTATGIWAFFHYHFMSKTEKVNELLAYYSDEYRKVDGEWRIHRTGYSPVIDRFIPRDAVPYDIVAPDSAVGL